MNTPISQPQTYDQLVDYFRPAGVEVTIRLLTVNESITGGNKRFKLKYNLAKAKHLGYKKILTFGGAFSNHIAATARAGAIQGFETVGVIRGEKSSETNVTLSRARADGMKLIFVSREDYRKKNEPAFLDAFINNHDQYYLIPEGGANAEGVRGCMEILCEADSIFDYITVCCGTGGTAAGLLMSMKSHQTLIGFSVLRDNGFIEDNINKWVEHFGNNQRHGTYEINHDYHFGGYARTTPELNNFCKSFSDETGIQIEPIYTGKMFFGINKLLDKEFFKKNSRLLVIHTGGMQYLK